jgi:hypothetical protein
VSSLPTWAVWEIVAACSLLGSVIALLVVLAVAVLDRWISMAWEASRRPVLEPAQSEPAQSEPAVTPPLGSLPTRLACAQLGLPGLREGPASKPRGMLATRQRNIASASLTPTCLIPRRLLQSCRRPKKAISRRPVRNLAQQRNQCVTHDHRHAEYAASTRSLHRFMMIETGRLQRARNAQFLLLGEKQCRNANAVRYQRPQQSNGGGRTIRETRPCDRA